MDRVVKDGDKVLNQDRASSGDLANGIGIVLTIKSVNRRDAQIKEENKGEDNRLSFILGKGKDNKDKSKVINRGISDSQNLLKEDILINPHMHRLNNLLMQVILKGSNINAQKDHNTLLSILISIPNRVIGMMNRCNQYNRCQSLKRCFEKEK